MIRNEDYDGFKVVLLLFLPLLCALEISRLLQFPIEALQVSCNYSTFLRTLPALRSIDYAHCRWALSAGAALVLAYQICSRSWKKPFLVLAAAFYLYQVLGASYLVCFLGGVWLLWQGSCLRNKPRPRLALAACGLGLVAVGLLTVENGWLRLMAWSYACLSPLKAYSLFLDIESQEQGPDFGDCFLYFTNGFPCYPWAVLYTYRGFTESFHSGRYWEVARGGIVRIHSGLAKFALLYLLEISLLPKVSFGRRLDWDAGGIQMGAVGVLQMLVYFMRIVAAFQIHQGANRLFGYRVQDQYDQPWLAASPLEFWRRFSIVNRQYFFKYVYYPAYQRGFNVYPAVALVFLASALITVANKIFPFSPGRLRGCLTFLMGIGLFAFLCGLEIKLSQLKWYRVWILDKQRAFTPQRVLSVALMALLGALIWKLPIPRYFDRILP